MPSHFHLNVTVRDTALWDLLDMGAPTFLSKYVSFYEGLCPNILTDPAQSLGSPKFWGSGIPSPSLYGYVQRGGGEDYIGLRFLVAFFFFFCPFFCDLIETSTLWLRKCTCVLDFHEIGKLHP